MLTGYKCFRIWSNCRYCWQTQRTFVLRK